MANNADITIKERKWLTLGLARAMLGINETTLRQWADHGLVRAFRTPGGHRRFSVDDINSLIEQNQQILSRTGAQRQPTEDTLLPRIRRRVQVMGTTTRVPAWMLRVTTSDSERLRTLGRELLELCAAATQHTPGKRSVHAAQRLGNSYATEARNIGIPFPDAIEAFVFFRSLTIETIKPTLTKQRMSSHDVSRCWTQINRLTDEVLLAMTNSFGTYVTPTGKTRKTSESRARRVN